MRNLRGFTLIELLVVYRHFSGDSEVCHFEQA